MIKCKRGHKGYSNPRASSIVRILIGKVLQQGLFLVRNPPSKEKITGLELLDIETEMAEQKTLKQVKLGNNIEGYEIHHGKTSIRSGQVIMASDDEILGVQNANVWGTYLHGIFDNDQYRMEFLNKLRKSKGLPVRTKPTMYNLEPEFDRLADNVRQNVEMDKIYKLMGL